MNKSRSWPTHYLLFTVKGSANDRINCICKRRSSLIGWEPETVWTWPKAAFEIENWLLFRPCIQYNAWHVHASPKYMYIFHVYPGKSALTCCALLVGVAWCSHQEAVLVQCVVFCLQRYSINYNDRSLHFSLAALDQTQSQCATDSTSTKAEITDQTTKAGYKYLALSCKVFFGAPLKKHFLLSLHWNGNVIFPKISSLAVP